MPGVETLFVRIGLGRDVELFRHVVDVVAIVRAGAVDGPGLRDGRRQLERGQRLSAGPLAVRSTIEQRARARPVAKDREHRAVAGIAEQATHERNLHADARADDRRVPGQPQIASSATTAICGTSITAHASRAARSTPSTAEASVRRWHDHPRPP